MIKNLIQELEGLSLLKHPFYISWNAGTLTKEVLADYACQYFQHVEAFPRYISAIHTRCKDIGTRQVLLGNLMEEELGDENHPALWMRFANRLGADKQRVESEAPYNETKALIDGLFDICNSSVAAGIGALFAYERQVPGVAESKIEGLKKFYGFEEDDAALKFFTVHIEADKWHSEECEKLISDLDPKSQEIAAKAAVKSAKLLWQFLDGVCNSESYKSCVMG